MLCKYRVPAQKEHIHLQADQTKQATAVTFAVIQHSIKVIDVTQAVAPQGQGVGAEAKAIVTHIKGTLPLEGSIWVTIGHCHLH